ncbi:helix-turn-helix domain-containing protein [Isoptericola sp. NPDC057391]|uniref:helix-turn-helix domain-containing protein n=1 Tax=Isoptericola sp. NPDC057391 TaxID=3346117 RepID=UPI00362AD641
MSTIVDASHGLGKRVRAERTRRGWSLSELAEASGVSRAMISKVERGEASPTATVLGKLSAAFELSVSSLLEPAAPLPGEGSGPRRDADVPAWTDPDTGYLRRQVSTPMFPADVTEVLLPAGARVPYPAAAYAFIAQLLWVLDGELTLTDGPDTHVLAAGDTFELGAPLPRVFANETTAGCRYVAVVTRRAEP